MSIETVGDLVIQLQNYMVDTYDFNTAIQIIDENDCVSTVDVLDYDPETNVLYLVSVMADDVVGDMADDVVGELEE